MLKLKMVLEAVDRVSAPMRRVLGLIKRTEVDTAALSRITDRYRARVGHLATALGSMAGIAASAAVGGIVALGIGVVRTASQFEQFQAILENTEGSTAKAKAAMSWVADFAARTPFEIDQVTGAFARLRGVGLDPVHGLLKTLGDAASAVPGADLMQAVEMMADAVQGQFERLNAYSVRASQKGQLVTFSYVNKAGKAVTVQAQKNALSIQKALAGIFDAKFGGLADKQSQTFAGIWSNIKDGFTRFELAIGNAGLFDTLKAQLQRVLDWINGLSSSGKLDQWAKQIGEQLKGVVDWIAGVDWKKVGDDLASIGRALKSIGSAAASIGFDGWINIGIVTVIWKMTDAAYALATALGFVSIAGAPLWAVFAVGFLAVASLVVVFRELSHAGNQAGFVLQAATAALSVLGGTLGGAAAAVSAIAATIRWAWEALPAFFKVVWHDVAAAFKGGAAEVWGVLPPWLQTAISGAGLIVRLITRVTGAVAPTIAPSAPSTSFKPGELLRAPPVNRVAMLGRQVSSLDPGSIIRARPLSPATPRAANDRFGGSGPRTLLRPAAATARLAGQLDIRVRADPGTAARTENVRSDNPRVQLKVTRDRGRTLPGAGL